MHITFPLHSINKPVSINLYKIIICITFYRRISLSFKLLFKTTIRAGISKYQRLRVTGKHFLQQSKMSSLIGMIHSTDF